MLERALARGDGRPQHGRQVGTQSRQIADHATLHEFFEIRHLARVQERVDDLPVSSVPADQQDFPGKLSEVGLRHELSITTIARRMPIISELFSCETTSILAISDHALVGIRMAHRSSPRRPRNLRYAAISMALGKRLRRIVDSVSGEERRRKRRLRYGAGIKRSHRPLAWDSGSNRGRNGRFTLRRDSRISR